MELRQALSEIGELDFCAMKKAENRLNSIAKPLRSLGVFEGVVIKLAGIFEDSDFSIDKKCVVVMCADNGVISQGITQVGNEVTAIMTNAISKGMSSVCKFAEKVGAEVLCFDVGVASEIEGEKIITHKAAYGTRDFSKEPSMLPGQAEELVLYGISIVAELKKQGFKIIATGEMGIGNTSSSAACIAAALGLAPENVVGRGAGLSDEGLERKIKIIKNALDLHKPDANNALDILEKVGGFDIAALCGVFIGGAIYCVPIVVDGLISSVAALLASKICPQTTSFMIASHATGEPAGIKILDELKLKPFIFGEMRLGEGTGAVMALSILDMVIHMYKTMPTFEEMQIRPYKPLK